MMFLSLEATDSAIEALSRAYRLSPDNEEIATTYAQISFLPIKVSLMPVAAVYYKMSLPKIHSMKVRRC
nr:hypothetical protein [Psychrobacter sp. PraFG1]UTT87792.1 hypothetical protein MN210_17195 [Psychrobacter sp. PraFG1]